MIIKKSFIYTGLRTLYYEFISFISFIKNKRFNTGFYSQFGEDKIIAEIFKNTSQGFYFDIGSGHPVYGSNTYYFYKKKWRGVTVDPIKYNYILHRILRPRDIAILSAVGSVDGKVETYIYPSHIFTTTNVDRKDQLMRENMHPMHSKIINCVRFDSIYQKVSAVIHEDYFLSIDVEGDEYNVLRSIDFRNFHPKLICVEDIAGNNADVRALLSENNYNFYKRCGLSDLYLPSTLSVQNL